jgi:hypothetical protein
MESETLGVRVHAARILAEKAAKADAGLEAMQKLQSPTADPLHVHTATMGSLHIDKHHIRAYKFLNFISLGTYGYFALRRAKHLLKQDDSWLNEESKFIKTQYATVLTAAVGDDASTSLESFCDKIFEPLKNPPVTIERAHMAPVKVNSTYELLEKCISPDFAKRFHDGSAMVTGLNADSIEKLFDPPSDSEMLELKPWSMLKLKEVPDGGAVSPVAFFAKAAQLSQLKHRNVSFAGDLTANKLSITNSPAVDKCFIDFLERLQGEFGMEPLASFFRNDSVDGLKSFHRHLLDSYFTELSSAIQDSSSPTLDDLSSFFSEQFSIQDFCKKRGQRDNLIVMETLLHIPVNDISRNLSLDDDRLAPAIIKLNELINDFRGELGRCLLSEHEQLNFAKPSTAKMTLKQRFAARSQKLGVTESELTAEPAAASLRKKDSMKEFCDKFLEPFDDSTIATEISPYMLLRAHISENLGDSDVDELMEQIASGKPLLELLLDGSTKGNLLRLKELSEIDRGELKPFLDAAIRWAKVSSAKKKLDNLRRQANGAIAKNLQRCDSKLRACLDGNYFEKFYGNFVEELKKPPLNQLFKIGDRTERYLAGDLFTLFFDGCLKIMETSNGNPSETLFDFFTLQFTYKRFLHFDLVTIKTFAKKMHLERRSSGVAIGDCSIYEKYERKAKIRLEEILNDFQNDIPIHLCTKFDQEEGEYPCPRTIIENAARKTLEQRDQDSGKSLNDQLAELQENYETMLDDFESGTAGE